MVLCTDIVTVQTKRMDSDENSLIISIRLLMYYFVQVMYQGEGYHIYGPKKYKYVLTKNICEYF